jgi:hypothetical protein
MARDARLLPGDTPGRRGRSAGKIPYLAGGEPISGPVRIPHQPVVYRTAKLDSAITARQLILGLLLGLASSILVTALLLIILLT